MIFFQKKPFFAVSLLAMILAFSFMGSRSLWEPDEGRYTNVALTIVDSNEWISLRRHPDSLHFTKPPLTYWTMAASVKMFGFNTWAARLPIALAYLFSILMIYRLGKILVREKPWLPALIFATCPLPFLAGNYISTDFILAACETLALLCFAQYAFMQRSKFWMDAMWAGFGLAFLAKGPPSLLPLLAIVVFMWRQKNLGSLFRPLGFLAFAVIGLAWYGIVVQRHPGLLDYFIGHEVIARVSDESMQRSPEWYGPIKVYLPTFLFGALPWLLVLAWSKYRNQAMNQAAKTADAEQKVRQFLWLWFLLPLAVFCLSRSRMPLYVLPLFTPLALLLALKLQHLNFNRHGLTGVLCLMAALLGLRFAISQYNHHKDPDVFAEKIMALTKEAPREIVFVEDMARYAQHLYLGAQINKVSFQIWPKNISDSQFDMSLTQALEQTPGKRIFIFKPENEQNFKNALQEKNISPLFLGTIADHKARTSEDRLVYTIPGEFQHIGHRHNNIDARISKAPQARSNWALASAKANADQEIFAFYGLGAGKNYSDIAKDVHAYSPAKNRWRKVGDIPVSQGVLASAASTINNKIYLAGGYTVAENGDEKSTPELFEFDPTTTSFKVISQMPTPVDDSVLLAWRERFLIFVSGWHDTGNVKHVQLFDTLKNTWFSATEYPGEGVFGHSGGMVGDSMIICDGVTAMRGKDGKNQFAMTDACYRGDLDINNPTKIKWLKIAKHPGLPIYRAAATGTKQLGTRVLFAGGANRAYNYNGIGYDGIAVPASDKVFSYEFATSQWREHAALAAPSMDHRTLIEIGGVFYLPGGMRNSQEVTSETLVFRL
jgi:Dolichyl-phosphate-mannose-protein mannosyltransferase